MPDHKLHITWDELMFGPGTSFPEVHQFMDQMQPVLQSKHREFYHDLGTVNEIYQTTGDYRKAISAYFHIILDNISMEVGQEHAIATLLNKIRAGEIRI
jgi:hypothetical protein